LLRVALQRETAALELFAVSLGSVASAKTPHA
jgi:hypothetical protein